MFEEIKILKKIDFSFIEKHNVSILDLQSLYNFGIIDISTIKDFLSKLINDRKVDKKTEDIIVDILIDSNVLDFKNKFDKLCDVKKQIINRDDVCKPMWLILKWLQLTNCMPNPGFDQVDFCSDLIVYFNFPELEKKLLYKSFSDWQELSENIILYLSNSFEKFTNSPKSEDEIGELLKE